MVVDPAYRVCLLRVDLRLAVRSPSIAEEGLIGEEHISILGASGFTPCHIVADVLGFALGDGAVDGDVKFRGRIDAVQVLFLEVHIHLKLPEHSGDLEAIQCVPGEAADGFDDDHVHLAALALANELVEFIPLFHTGAGNALIGVNARQLPAGFPVDAIRVITHLCFVAVELFFLLGGHPAVGRHTLEKILCAVYIQRLHSCRNGSYPFRRCVHALHPIAPF